MIYSLYPLLKVVSGISLHPVNAEDFFNTVVTNDPDGGKTTVTTNGNDEVTEVDKTWPNGDKTHVDVDPKTGDEKVTETLAGKDPLPTVDVKPGESVTTGNTTVTNTSDKDPKNPTEMSHVTDVIKNPDGGTTTISKNPQGEITDVDKTWPNGDKTHVDVDPKTGIEVITETPKDKDPLPAVTLKPGETATVGKTTATNDKPDAIVTLTHDPSDGSGIITGETVDNDGKIIYTKTQSENPSNNGNNGSDGSNNTANSGNETETADEPDHDKLVSNNNANGSGTNNSETNDNDETTDIDADRLPQTGEADNNTGILGALVALLGLSLLLVPFKKRKEDK